ncbi:sarcosine oxidase subunit alpha [Alloyangia pacifica]|uniref:Sarcosine oxidase subunit alpha n=1 Tax=Alloyangia pacifica TaxID=311180 RepID=A0A2U8HJ17_9RHOB|nr:MULTISPECIES: (2Fe-2S)-binding protein [Roseobacteraceae]AWI85738.1 sarcosine oxidase subunit alpha [Alloyangia pacifica]NDV52012.1 (2Fe-2S)-binding protein [Salipiger sp. PrR003]
MFRPLPDRPTGPTVTVFVEGQPVEARDGETAASVLLRHLGSARITPVSESPRAPFCMMGCCFDCLAEIDGKGSTQSCLVPVREGMTIARQMGARKVVG